MKGYDMYYENKQGPERALLLALELEGEDSAPLLDELAELAKTAGIEVVACVTQKRDAPNTATYVGAGRLKEIQEFCSGDTVDTHHRGRRIDAHPAAQSGKGDGGSCHRPHNAHFGHFPPAPIRWKGGCRSSWHGTGICFPG